jgi:biotin operon repressor
MSTYDNGDGRGFFISADTISQLTGMNERTVRTSIKKLQDAGWIKQT